MRVIAAVVAVPLCLMIDYNIRVGFLDLLPVLCNMDLLSVISTSILKILTVVRTTAEVVTAALLWPTLAKPFRLTALVIFSRFYIDLFIKDVMTFLLILHDDLLFQ